MGIGFWEEQGKDTQKESVPKNAPECEASLPQEKEAIHFIQPTGGTTMMMSHTSLQQDVKC